MRRRVLSLFLAVAMVIGLMPGSTMTALADGVPTIGTLTIADEFTAGDSIALNELDAYKPEVNDNGVSIDAQGWQHPSGDSWTNWTEGVLPLDTSSTFKLRYYVTYSGGTITITSNEVTLNVVGNSTTLALDSSPESPQNTGTPITLTATLTGFFAAAGVNGHDITFKKDGSTLGTADLDADGVATYIWTPDSAGTYSLTAEYAATAYNDAATSNAISWESTAFNDTAYVLGAEAGTSSEPKTYNISNETQLRDLATTVNNGTSYQYTTFVLQNDIALSGGDWTPIGNLSEPFKGTFDGNNKKITGIKIGSESAPDSTLTYVGLFGYVDGGTIKNLGVEAVIYSKLVTSDINGSSSVGGLVGYNGGTIINSYATGNIIVEGMKDGTRKVVAGGLVGWNTGTITNSYATANVTGVSLDYLGGLVGLNTGTAITNSYATGNVTCSGVSGFVGGLVGVHNGTAINNSYATGNVTCSGDSSYVGGLVGENYRVITNSYWNSDATQTVDGKEQSPKKGAGSGTSAGVTSMESDSMQADSFVATLNANLDTLADTTLYKWQVKASDYPTFSDTLWSAPATTTIEKAITIDTAAPVTAEEIANGTVAVPTGATDPEITWAVFGCEGDVTYSESWYKSTDYLRYMSGAFYKTKYVYTAEAPYQFDSTITADDITVTNLGSGTKSVTLTENDQVLTITVTWPITEKLPNWADGINATTAAWDNGGTITTAAELAQFAYNVNNGKTYAGKTITLEKDIDLSAHYWTPIGISSQFDGTFDGNGKIISGLKIYQYYWAGSASKYEWDGLFGCNGGTIKNLGVEGVNVYSVNSLKVGGLLGLNYGTIENCYSKGEISQPYGNRPTGGLAGENQGQIKDSYAETNIFSFGQNVFIGGLVGQNLGSSNINDNTSGTIINSYATGSVTSPSPAYAGGLVGNSKLGLISNSHATGNITCGHIEGFDDKMGTNPSGNASVGGLVGFNQTRIDNSYATGDATYNYIDGDGRGGSYGDGYTDYNVGGLVGSNFHIITNSYATGNVTGGDSIIVNYEIGDVEYIDYSQSDIISVGGLAGINAQQGITNCYALGNVTGGESTNVGGLAGINLLYSKIENCYAAGDVTSGESSNIGGFLGINNAQHITYYTYWNSDAAQVVDGEPQTTKKGIGFYSDEYFDDYDNNQNIGMTSSNMKDPSFVTTLNHYLDLYEDETLLKWKAMADDYPTFSNSYWTPLTKITNPGTITIGTTSPVTGASITDGTGTQLELASGPVITWSADYGATWTASGSFAANTYYKTQYVYRANEGYKFDRDMTYDITVSNLGSGTKNVTLNDADKSLIITVTWPSTTTAEVVTINGTVRDKGGNPVKGATVTLTPGAGTPNPATTGNAGQYTIINVPKGNYNVTVTLPNGGGSFTKNITVTGANMDLQQPVAPTYTVSGSIKDAADNSPVSGAAVTLTNTTDNTKTYTGTTDINGNYTIPGVPDGSYAIDVTKNGETYNSGDAVITVSGSNVSGESGNISVTTPTHTITGNVKDEDNANVNNASVKLMAGSRQVAQAVTDIQGDFTISGVLAGKYNLVITKGDQKITLVITVLNSDLTTGSITLPRGKKNSVLDVKPNTPDIVVDKLNDFFDSEKFTPDDRDVVDAGGMVEIKLSIEIKNESGDNVAENANSIKTSAQGSGKAVGIFLNLTLSKIVTPAGGAAEPPVLIDELSDLLIIDIPLPTGLQGKSAYVIYRYHGTEVQAITQTINSDGEYIEVSADGKSIKLHAKKFSTYAIAYTEPSTPGTSSGGHRGRGTTVTVPTVTADSTIGGQVTLGSDKKTVTITPDEGYVIADVLVDGKSIGATTNYTFTDSKNHTIKAVFVKESALPYYLQDGKKVFIGFTATLDKILKYTAPEGVTVQFEENPKQFTDIQNHWAKENIDFVTEREIFAGTASNTFAPQTSMTRSMLAAVIGRLYERSYGIITGTSSSTFTDVDVNAYYAKYVVWANENGIVKGVGNNKFAPDENVTREQMAVIMSKLAALLKKTVADVSLTYPDSASISSWAIEGAKYCQETCIIAGRSGENFAPQESATRAEVAAVIERFIKTIMK